MRAIRPGRGIAAALILLTTRAGCGGGGGSAANAPPPPAGPDTGDLIVTVTDAPGDFVAYIVDVTSIRLERASGDTVETLPLTTRIDFAQLTEVTEFLSVATVPAGVYQRVTLGLDFTDAEILIQDDAGAAVPAQVVDGAGDPLGQIEVELSLAGDSAVRITPATVHAFSLDFDLDASSVVDDAVTPPVVTVEPVLLAMPALEEDREHRLRGRLARVDEGAQTVTLAVRPFRHRHGAFGRFTFAVDDATVYEIDGAVFTGGVGLVALNDLGADAPVVAQGHVAGGDFLAAHVLAGDSVHWAEADVVHGTVLARGADTLTLGGVAVAFADGRYTFSRSITVSVGAGTVVSAPGAVDLDERDVSVGQRVAVSGEFTDDLTLDATSGRVRMLVTRLWGEVVTPDPLVTDLALIDGRRPGVFDFTGTGVVSAEDADPSAYQPDTATLGLLDVAAGDLVQIRGLVNRFGFAPPDFLARTVVDTADGVRAATARVGWPGGTATPFAAVTPDRLDLDPAGARAALTVHGRFRPLPLDALALVAPASGVGAYTVVERGRAATVHREFAAAVTAMTALLDAGARLHRLTAHGGYTVADDELTTVRASFVFEVAGSGAAVE